MNKNIHIHFYKCIRRHGITWKNDPRGICWRSTNPLFLSSLSKMLSCLETLGMLLCCSEVLWQVGVAYRENIDCVPEGGVWNVDGTCSHLMQMCVMVLSVQTRYTVAKDSVVQFFFYQPISHQWRQTDFFPCTVTCGGGEAQTLFMNILTSELEITCAFLKCTWK